jgi:hypothetical protein
MHVLLLLMMMMMMLIPMRATAHTSHADMCLPKVLGRRWLLPNPTPTTHWACISTIPLHAGGCC